MVFVRLPHSWTVKNAKTNPWSRVSLLFTISISRQYLVVDFNDFRSDASARWTASPQNQSAEKICLPTLSSWSPTWSYASTSRLVAVLDCYGSLISIPRWSSQPWPGGYVQTAGRSGFSSGLQSYFPGDNTRISLLAARLASGSLCSTPIVSTVSLFIWSNQLLSWHLCLQLPCLLCSFQLST